MHKTLRIILAAGIFAGSCDVAGAVTTVTGQFNVTMTINAACAISAATDLAFGSSGIMSADVTQNSSLTVKCTQGTAYQIGLGDGNNFLSPTRRMVNAADNTKFITYELLKPDNSPWTSTSTVSSTGTGVDQTFTVKGRVPQQSVAPGSYSDVVQVVVTY
ncbi:MAG: Csu type fimbrial protein [Methylocystis sp.]|uniref:Csu type fimbrial protein n=1 Tax=Methylocystis sp. TaxID=1911079 RepID=UPI003DA677A0